MCLFQNELELIIRFGIIISVHERKKEKNCRRKRVAGDRVAAGKSATRFAPTL